MLDSENHVRSRRFAGTRTVDTTTSFLPDTLDKKEISRELRAITQDTASELRLAISRLNSEAERYDYVHLSLHDSHVSCIFRIAN